MVSKIAIVVPVYNVEKYVAECLQSILDQTYQDWECFVVDDGSTDGSGGIIDRFAGRDARFKVFHKKNGGVSSARNMALDAIFHVPERFSYLGFTDSDDRLPSNFLEVLVQAIQSEDVSMALCPRIPFDRIGITDTIHPEKRIIETDELIEMEFNDPSIFFARFLGNKLFRTSDFRFPRFDESLKISEDKDFYMRVVSSIRSCILVPETHYQYRRRKSSLVNSNYTFQDFIVYSRLLASEYANYSFSNQVLFQGSFIKAFCEEIKYCFQTDRDSDEIRQKIVSGLSMIKMFRQPVQKGDNWLRIKRMQFLPFFLLRWYERKRLKKITKGNEIKKMNYFE